MAYADYHVLVATLAPIFWLAGLVGIYRAGAHGGDGGARTRRTGRPRKAETELPSWVSGAAFIFLATVVLVVNVGLSLDVLGGWGQSTEGIRGGQAGLLAFQMLIGFAGFVADVAHRDRRD